VLSAFGAKKLEISPTGNSKEIESFFKLLFVVLYCSSPGLQGRGKKDSCFLNRSQVTGHVGSDFREKDAM
jgi:hypothetical protein